jgi:hypothetical protein
VNQTKLTGSASTLGKISERVFHFPSKPCCETVLTLFEPKQVTSDVSDGALIARNVAWVIFSGPDLEANNFRSQGSARYRGKS